MKVTCRFSALLLCVTTAWIGTTGLRGGAIAAEVARQDRTATKTDKARTDGSTDLGETVDKPTPRRFKPEELGKLHILLVGDSTVCESVGWGRVLDQYFINEAVIVNRAIAGQSSSTFFGSWNEALTSTPKCYYVLIQFGHNDCPFKKKGRYNNPHTTYKDNLGRYIEDSLAQGTKPILVTPVPRRFFDPRTGKMIPLALAPYAQAVRETAEKYHVPLIDLHEMGLKEYNRLGPEKCKEFDPKLGDATHFSLKGAHHAAQMVVKGLRQIKPDDFSEYNHPWSPWITDYLREEDDRFDEGYVLTWQVSGPYVSEGKIWSDIFDEVYPPEKADAENVVWKTVPANPEDDIHANIVVNLGNSMGGDNRVAYLRTNIWSDKQRKVLLELGSDDGIKVWFNDDLIHVNKIARGVKPGDDLVEVTLRKGVNTFMLKVAQDKNGWGACMRIRELDGGKLEGLEAKLPE